MSGPSGGDNGKDALADYMRALQKLNGSKKSSAPDNSEIDPMASLMQSIEPADSREKAASGGDPLDLGGPDLAGRDQPARKKDDSLNLYLQALDKAKAQKASQRPSEAKREAPLGVANLEEVRGALKAETIESQMSSADGGGKEKGAFRRGLDRLRQRGTRPGPAKKKKAPRRVPAAAEVVPEAPPLLEAETPPVPEPIAAPRQAKVKPPRKAKAKAKAKPKRAAARAESTAPFRASPGTVKTGALLVCLALGLLLQRLIYALASMPYGLNDLAVGTAIAMPVLLVLVLVQPQTQSDWTALLASACAIAVTGGLGVALGVSLLHANAIAMNETGYIVQLFVHLSVLTLIWGPVFLTVTGLLHRMELLKLSGTVEF